MKGVLDRIEDGVAVVLIEEKGEEFTLAEYDLPTGSKEGTWFEVTYENGVYVISAIDEQMTKERSEVSKQLLKKLQQKKKQSKFKRN